MAQLTNKSTNKDLEFYIKECSHTMGLREDVGSNDPKATIVYMLKQIMKYKMEQ